MSSLADRRHEPVGRPHAAGSPRLPVDRRLYILDRIAAQGSVRLHDLARELGTSVMTVRRDIKRLEEDGFLRRSYGGATAHVMLDLELGPNGLSLQHMAEKRAIAQAAAALLEPRDVLFLGTGTTVAQFARHIPTGRGITVVTYSLTIASLLGTKPGVTVISTGGTVDSNDLSQVGAVAASTLSRYYATKAFIGAGGIHAEAGVSDYSDAVAALNHLMVERSEQTYVLADSSKLGARTLAQVCQIADLGGLVTDGGAPPDLLDGLRRGGLEVVIPEGAAESLRPV
jgi:DeoR/GlpR family transcriptional regulator of sugar metabolism